MKFLEFELVSRNIEFKFWVVWILEKETSANNKDRDWWEQSKHVSDWSELHTRRVLARQKRDQTQMRHLNFVFLYSRSFTVIIMQ